MRIRELGAGERPAVSMPIEAYAFRPSPADADTIERAEHRQRYHEGDVVLVAEENGEALAVTSALSMPQNLRGTVYPMAGVAGVATLPLARRHGCAHALVTEALGLMRDRGHVLSTLYPFRPSFYQRYGYAGLPISRTVTFAPENFAHLLRAGLPGKLTWEPASSGYAAYRAFTERLLTERHGFAVVPAYRAVQFADSGNRWLAMAWDGGEAIGAVSYRITGYGGVLAADDLLAASPLGRALLLQFFARHTDQVREIEVQVPPGEFAELWGTDVAMVTRAATSFPGGRAPMARVLSLTALAGLPVGRERVVIQVVDDPYIAGTYLLDGRAGSLEVTTKAGPEAEATLTAAGLSGLVYGVLDGDEVVVRGLGEMPGECAARLGTLFPRRVPQLFAQF
ncbi:MAG TPA: GNAT family N-acetyltransferase [Streptosporangiaceae bacterium]|nr:GNAT family N-acetyltransferase [Streptosporangiaceae bacterium]